MHQHYQQLMLADKLCLYRYGLALILSIGLAGHLDYNIH